MSDFPSSLNALFVLFVILFGTLIPFFLYLESLRYIRPTETSLLASAEPLTAAVAAVLWLKVPFGLPEWVGALCIASVPSGDMSRRLFNQLLAWGMSMTVAGAVICYVLFG